MWRQPLSKIRHPERRLAEASAHETEAATLTLQMGPGSHQPAALVIQMRKFNLQRAFPRLGPSAEDLKDQSSAVQYLGVPGLFQVALLDRRQRAIHDHQFDIVPGDQAEDLLDLALAEIGRRPDLADRRDQRIGDAEVDGARQPHRLLEPCLGIADARSIGRRLSVATAHAQIRADDDHPPATLACG